MVMRLVACGSITFDSIHFNLLTWILIFKVGFYGSHAKIPKLGVKISEFTSEKKPPMNDKYSVFHSSVI